MKSFLQNLLIFFALALCGLIAYQWVRETGLRRDLQGLTDSVQNEKQKGQDLGVAIKRDEAEIQRLDGIKNQLSQTIKSNDVRITSLARDLDKSTLENERSQKQVEAYKTALETANDSIKKQNEDIKHQNEEMTKLAEERNEITKKFNKIASEYNELASRWNKQQEELAKAATNTPAPPAAGKK
jgi:chromosome segregation ATPase